MDFCRVRPKTGFKYVLFLSLALMACFLLLQHQVILDSASGYDRHGLHVDSSKTRENPAVKTALLYEPGFNISCSHLCVKDAAGPLRMLVLITSAPGHRDQRKTIRDTWGHVALRQDVALAFFVGMATQAEVNSQLVEESRVFGDIIQGNFVDNYNNLTLKTVSMMEWTLAFCSSAKLLLKTDDDMFINFPKLFQVLDKRFQNASRAIIGNVARRWKPFRDPKSPYFLSTQQYPDKILPDFNSGPAYVITSDAIAELYNATLESTFFKLEDVFITGMVAAKLGVKRIHAPEFYNKRTKTITPCYAANGVSVHMVRKEEMYSLWTKLSTGDIGCGPGRPKI